MTNYLDRLAAMAAGTAPVLEPRVPSRFEPAAPTDPGAGGWGESYVETEPGAEHRDASPPAPATPAPPAWPSPVGRGAPEVPATPRTAARQAPQPDQPAEPRAGRGPAAPTDDAGDGGRERAPSPAWSTPAPPPVRDTPTPPAATTPDRATVDRLLALLSELGSETSPGGWPQRPRPTAGPTPGRLRPASATPPAPATPGRLVPRQVPTAAGLLGPDPARGPSRRERHDGPPAVHVHIGRIEVRAPASAPTPEPPAAPGRVGGPDSGAGAPALEDYLQDPPEPPVTTPYALGAVTAVLRSRLTAALAASGVSASVGGVSVTALPPDRMVTGAQEKNVINLFLHRLSRNPGWANAGPPSRNSAGDLVSPLPYGVDLHYIVSAYGQDPLTAEILLGHAVATFFDEPVLTRAAIRRALAPSPPDPTIPPAVSASRLADQFETLKLSSTNPDLEELSRMWTSFMAPYRPSTYLDVTAVLIETTQPARTPFPVFAVGSAAVSAETPQVDTVTAAGPAGTPITAGATLVIAGQSLAGPGLAVRVGASVAAPASVSDHELTVPVASFAPPLRAGLQGLVITHDVALGDPPVAHAATASDAFPLALRPAASFANNAVTVASTATIDGVAVASGTIATGMAPAVTRDQQLLLTLAEVGAPTDRPARGASLVAPAGNGLASNATEAATVTFAFASVPRGTYVARLVVDGVESAVTMDNSGRFAQPAVTV